MTITKYLAVLAEQPELSLKDILNKAVWVLQDDKPDTPYVKLRIRVIERERRYRNAEKDVTRTFKVFGLTFSVKWKSRKRVWS